MQYFILAYDFDAEYCKNAFPVVHFLKSYKLTSTVSQEVFQVGGNSRSSNKSASFSLPSLKHVF